MKLEDQKLKFATITHHASVTQCLDAIGGLIWYVAVAKPSILEDEILNDSSDDLQTVKKSNSGHYYLPPSPDEVIVFRVSGSKFLKLNKETWHEGPLFRENSMDFYNSELSDTYEVDQMTHSFRKNDRVLFVIED